MLNAMDKKVLAIMELALALKKKGHDVFVDYYPHVDKMTVRIFKDGWDKDKADSDEFLCRNFYFDDGEKPDKLIEELKELYDE